MKETKGGREEGTEYERRKEGGGRKGERKSKKEKGGRRDVMKVQ